MKSSPFQTILRLAVVQACLLLCQTGLAVVSFAVTPAAVSNTYVGPITLQVTGLAGGESVVVQKFNDANANGKVDGGDSLAQQFNLTDGASGMVIGAVTNTDVPGDTDGSANGTITAVLNFPGGEFAQNIVGKYPFKLSSPVGHFSPITNVFNVTNFPFGQKITGNVVSSGANVPYASVILFPAPRSGGNGPGTPVAGTVANSAGAYTIQLPPGTYVPMAFKSNYVASYLASPVLTLNSSQTITTNLSLTIATASISGKFVDVLNPGIGLPGLLEIAMNSSGFIGTGSSASNGNFTIRVTSGQWQLDGSPLGLALHGYVAYNNGTNVNAGTTGFVGGFYKATSLFYGTVKEDSGTPLPGIAIGASDNNYQVFDNDGYSDVHGNYFTGALGGLGSGDPWHAEVNHKSEHPNYLFSRSPLEQSGGTNLAAGQVVRQNFTAILVTNHISGRVQFNGTNIIGVQVYAHAIINGNNYQTDMDTDANGNYSLNVCNGDWNVNVYQCCANDSLDSILGSGNYQPPSGQNVTVNNNNPTNNFIVQPCSGVQIFTANLPDGQVGVYYNEFLQGSTCSGNANWSLNDPQDFPSSLSWSGNGEIQGTPDTAGTFHFSVTLDDGNGHSTNQAVSLYIAPASMPLQVTTMSLPNGTNGALYSQTIQASGGQMPYSWSIPNYSANPPPNLALATNGVLSGTLATSGGPFYFDVEVTDGAANTAYQTLSVYVVNPPLPPLMITNVALPNGNVGAAYSAQLGATGGQTPYTWSLALGSANPPVTLFSSGLLSGTPTTNKEFTFKVQVMDGNFATTNKVVTITVNPKPSLGSPGWVTNRFRMWLAGASNQNYTIQTSTNLSSTNWISLFITNHATANSFNVTDPNATNQQRFYRALIGP